MTMDQITGIVRAVLAMVGGVFVSKGMVSSEVMNWGIGGLLTVGATVWSLWSNRPAGLAASTQSLKGVNVQTTAAAPEAVKTAVAEVKKTS
jgi:hypothetical protein